MSATWYAAFALLGLLSIANAVLLVAMMRQIGVLHQRIHPTGALEEEGPSILRRMPKLDLQPVAGSREPTIFQRPMTLLVYVTAGCGACDALIPLVDVYSRESGSHNMDLALATDAPPDQASIMLREHKVQVPFVRHDLFSTEYDIKASPYVLGLMHVDDNQATENHTIVLGGGIVNTLEQLEDVARQVAENYGVQRGGAETTSMQRVRARAGTHAVAYEQAGTESPSVEGALR